jgi:oligopeptide/dipeptide ABC transporter ATP-binding protein
MAELMAVRDLAVHFPGRRGAGVARAVDGVSLDWRADEVLGVVGESGCGKSTMARALMGLVAPSAGTITCVGADSVRERRRRVQMVFQDPYQTLNPRMRVRAIVEEPLLVQGLADDGRVERALDDVGLPAARFASRYPHELSGGQRQRVAIAAALVLEPAGLICDEPVSMLDVSVRAQVLQVLERLRRERSLAILFITHDLGLAWALCDRIAVMYLGRVVEEGPAQEVIERPRHPYTQALVAAVPDPARPAEERPPVEPGEVPDAAHIPPGCRFHPRCPHRFEPCDARDPALMGEERHRAACLLLDPGLNPSSRSATAPS